MSRDVIVGVDAGTSVIKAVAFDRDGAEIAAAGRPNHYVDLPGRRRRAGHGAHLGRHGRGPARSGASRSPISPRASLALAVTGQGDGTWLIDARRRAGGAGLALARLPCGRRSSASSSDSGVRALDLPPHRLRPERLQAVGPPGLAQAPRAASARPRRHRLPLQGLALLQAHRRARAPIPPRAPSPSATSAPAPTCPRSWAPLGSPPSSTCCRRCSRAAGSTHPLDRRGCRRDRAARGPAGRAGLSRRALHRRWAAGIYEPGRAIGCSIVGSTGMHMRFVPDADGLAARPGALRLHHGVPGAGQRHPDAVQHGGDPEHRLGGRPRARGGRAARRTRSTARPRWRRSMRACSRPSPRPRSIIPTSTRPASAGRSSTSTPGRSSPGCRCATRLPGSGARGLRGLGVRGARLLRRDGPSCPRRSGSPAAPRARRRSRPSSRPPSTRRSARARARKPARPVRR